MTVLVIVWASVAGVMFLSAFLTMVVAEHNSRESWRRSRDQQTQKSIAKWAMWLSLASPLWPLSIIILPALLIKWVVGRYSTVISMVVK